MASVEGLLVMADTFGYAAFVSGTEPDRMAAMLKGTAPAIDVA